MFKRDSVSLFKFSILNQVILVISCAISLVCCLKHQFSWFSSHFCFVHLILFFSSLQIFYSHESFIPASVVGLFLWRLSDGSFRRSPGHLSVFCLISIMLAFEWSRGELLIFFPSNRLSKALRIIASMPIITAITLTLIFHSFLSSLPMS